MYFAFLILLQSFSPILFEASFLLSQTVVSNLLTRVQPINSYKELN